MEKRDNYALQRMQAQKHFLSYDQQELIRRCKLKFDDAYFYVRFLSQPYRICRRTGAMERETQSGWVDANSFNEVLTLLDWLCDSREDRYITGNWVNIVSQNHAFHTGLQDGPDPTAELFDRQPEKFRQACLSLGGEALSGGDISYAIELVDGLRILVQLWHADEEFPPRLCLFWDENTTRYIRYETTWYAAGLLLTRLREQMER